MRGGRCALAVTSRRRMGGTWCFPIGIEGGRGRRWFGREVMVVRLMLHGAGIEETKKLIL